jgi:hypothetical protein
MDEVQALKSMKASLDWRIYTSYCDLQKNSNKKIMIDVHWPVTTIQQCGCIYIILANTLFNISCYEWEWRNDMNTIFNVYAIDIWIEVAGGGTIAVVLVLGLLTFTLTLSPL